MDDHGEDRWKVGELASRAGVSVRTLHHYDEIGLLEPADRTRSGHRLYGRAEVRRLHQIASLREVGLSLGEIAELLDDDGLSLEETVEMQLERLRREMARQERLVRLLEDLRGRLRDQEEPDLTELTRTMAATLRNERYYTPEQLRALRERAERVGPERMEEAGREWRELLGAFGRAMEDGAEPASPRVQGLARRARALVEEFTGGNAGIRASLGRMYREEGGEAVTSLHGMEVGPGVWAYMARAREALEGEEADGGSR